MNIPVQEVLKIYQRSKLAVIPCFERYRSSGQMVLLESASAALPIIASKIKGISGAFAFQDKKHLLFVDPQNPSDLRKKILYLLNNSDYSNQLGKEASKFVKNNYTTFHLAKKLSKFIDKL